MNSVDYAEVLADLERRKAELEVAIVAIRRLANLPAPPLQDFPAAAGPQALPAASPARPFPFLGMTIPVPDSLIQMTLFLAAITFMYIGARAVGGGEYRSRFLDPLIENLESTLLARNRYRGQTRLE